MQKHDLMDINYMFNSIHVIVGLCRSYIYQYQHSDD